MNAAERRYRFERAKRRVAHHYGGWASQDAATLGRVARTRTLCSCWMCGNPRRKRKGVDRLTVQERRWLSAWGKVGHWIDWYLCDADWYYNMWVWQCCKGCADEMADRRPDWLRRDDDLI